MAKRSSLCAATIHLRIRTSFDNKDALLVDFNDVGVRLSTVAAVSFFFHGNMTPICVTLNCSAGRRLKKTNQGATVSTMPVRNGKITGRSHGVERA